MPKYNSVPKTQRTRKICTLSRLFLKYFSHFYNDSHRRRYKQGKSPKHPKHQNEHVVPRPRNEPRYHPRPRPIPYYSTTLTERSRSEQTAREDCESSARPTRGSRPLLVKDSRRSNEFIVHRDVHRRKEHRTRASDLLQNLSIVVVGTNKIRFSSSVFIIRSGFDARKA